MGLLLAGIRTVLAACTAGTLVSVVVSSAVSSLLTALILAVSMPTLVDARVDALRAGEITAVGENGADRIRLSPGPGDVAQVSVANTLGEDRIRLRVETTADGQPDAGIAIRTPGANPVTVMRLGTIAQDAELPSPLLHSANLLLRDENGHDRIRLLIDDAGNPKIELINSSGELVWSAP
jgi:hypothetical protein